MSTWNPKANDIFLQAAEIHSPEVRGSLLTEACGDDGALRAPVEALLDAGACARLSLASPSRRRAASVCGSRRQSNGAGGDGVW